MIDRNELILLALERRVLTYELLAWAKSCSIELLQKLVDEAPATLAKSDNDDMRRRIAALRNIFGPSEATATELAERVIATSIDTDVRNEGEQLTVTATTAGISVESILQRRRELDAETNDD